MQAYASFALAFFLRPVGAALFGPAAGPPVELVPGVAVSARRLAE